MPKNPFLFVYAVNMFVTKIRTGKI